MLLKKTKEWTKGKAFIPSTISVWLMMHTDFLYSYLENRITGKLDSKLPIDNIQNWLKQYRKHFSFKKAFVRQAPSQTERASMVADGLAPLIKPYIEQYRANPESFKTDSEDNFRQHLDLFEKTIVKTFLNDFEYDPELLKDTNGDSLKLWGGLPKSIFECFELKIQLPCWILYQTFPVLLLHKARHGNIDALDKLLRLDKSAIFDPMIAKIWEYESRYPKKQRFKMISKALGSTPRETISRKGFKIFLAAVIEKIFSDFQQPICRPAIQKLFDSFAHDAHNKPYDMDLPDSPEAFSTAVKREIKSWDNTR